MTSLAILLSLATISSPAEARYHVDETCLECGTCEPFDGPYWDADIFGVNDDFGFGSSVDYHWVENLWVSYGGRPGSDGCYEDEQGEWGMVTFQITATATDILGTHYIINEAGWSGESLGDIGFYHSEPGGDLWYIALYDLEVIGWNGGAIPVDVSHPGERSLAFTVQPGWGEVWVVE